MSSRSLMAASSVPAGLVTMRDHPGPSLSRPRGGRGDPPSPGQGPVCHHHRMMPAPAMPASGPATPPGRPGGGWVGITRSGTDRVGAGLAAGIGARLSVDPVYVRVAFAALAAAG